MTSFVITVTISRPICIHIEHVRSSKSHID